MCRKNETSTHETSPGIRISIHCAFFMTNRGRGGRAAARAGRTQHVGSGNRGSSSGVTRVEPSVRSGWAARVPVQLISCPLLVGPSHGTEADYSPSLCHEWFGSSALENLNFFQRNHSAWFLGAQGKNLSSHVTLLFCGKFLIEMIDKTFKYSKLLQSLLVYQE